MLSNSGLLYFAEVARQGSFQGGAEQLHVAVSAVSRQVALLEQELEVPLFERRRGKRPLRLTAAGESLMLHVQALESGETRMRAEILALRGLTKGTIRFGTSENFVRHRFPDALAAFGQQHPGIGYEVEIASTRRLLELLAEGELDAGLVFNPVATTGVRQVFEVSLENHVLVPLGHPLAAFESVRLSDCAGYGMALPGRELSSKVIYEAMFAKARIRPHVVLVSNSYELLITAAIAGLAIALVNAPLLSAPPAGTAPSYRCVPLRDPLMKPVRLAICVHEGRALPLATLQFIEHLKRTLLDIGAG